MELYIKQPDKFITYFAKTAKQLTVCFLFSPSVMHNANKNNIKIIDNVPHYKSPLMSDILAKRAFIPIEIVSEEECRANIQANLDKLRQQQPTSQWSVPENPFTVVK